MEQADRCRYVERYERRLEEHGYSPQALGWGKHGRQEVRFSVLAKDVLEAPESSVLDVGCGFADLYDFLTERGWRGDYTGIDIVPALLRVARQRHPDLDLRELDISEDPDSLGTYDFVIASGVFNAKLAKGDNRSHILQSLEVMTRHARVAVSADFLTAYLALQAPADWHTEPEWLLSQVRQFNRRLMLRCDYMPYEFALILLRDDRISERKVFEGLEEQIRR